MNEVWVPQTWIGVLVGPAIAVVVFVAYLIRVAYLNKTGQRNVDSDTDKLVVGIAVPLLLCMGPVLGFAVARPPAVNTAAVSAEIEAAYDISSVRPVSGAGDPGRLCEPVSLDSPKFDGVVNSKKISFHAGIPDCENPEPEIIIIDPAGQELDVEGLRVG